MLRLKKLLEDAFDNAMYQNAKKEFLKYFPKEAMKDIWALKTSMGGWNGDLGKSKWFPDGVYWSGPGHSAAYTKAQILAQAIRDSGKDSEYQV